VAVDFTNKGFKNPLFFVGVEYFRPCNANKENRVEHLRPLRQFDRNKKCA
jgi:hypothetical protein